MKSDDLTQVKYVGVSRMKLLNDLGITTIKQLYEMPLEKLAQIKTISIHYAKMIKGDAAQYCVEDVPDKTVPVKEKGVEEINRNLQKQIRRLTKRISRLNEDLKPLWKKKYLSLYIDYKKRSKKLKARLNAIGKIQEDLSNEVKKDIIKKADALNSTLKNVGKKTKKKKTN